MARPAGLPDPKLDEKLDEAFGSERPSTPTVNRLELDDARQSLDAAMAYLQTHLPRVAKGETAEITGTTKDGRPFTKKYDYAQLDDVSEAILPLLGRLGLSWRTCPTLVHLEGEQGYRFVLQYALKHVNGDVIEGMWPLPDRADPQAVGSVITYARRYCLCAVTGLAPGGDDDGTAGREASRRGETLDEASTLSLPPRESESIVAALEPQALTPLAQYGELWKTVVARRAAGKPSPVEHDGRSSPGARCSASPWPSASTRWARPPRAGRSSRKRGRSAGTRLSPGPGRTSFPVRVCWPGATRSRPSWHSGHRSWSWPSPQPPPRRSCGPPPTSPRSWACSYRTSWRASGCSSPNAWARSRASQSPSARSRTCRCPSPSRAGPAAVMAPAVDPAAGGAKSVLLMAQIYQGAPLAELAPEIDAAFMERGELTGDEHGALHDVLATRPEPGPDRTALNFLGWQAEVAPNEVALDELAKRIKALRQIRPDLLDARQHRELLAAIAARRAHLNELEGKRYR
jgi:hypothetical protein